MSNRHLHKTVLLYGAGGNYRITLGFRGWAGNGTNGTISSYSGTRTFTIIDGVVNYENTLEDQIWAIMRWSGAGWTQFYLTSIEIEAL